jgi:hypothetical protein
VTRLIGVNGAAGPELASGSSSVCYEPMGSDWTTEELLDGKDVGALQEGWETGHVTPRNVDQ